jgi:hypothetical protein
VMGLGLVLAGIRLMFLGPTSDLNKWRGFAFAPLAVGLGLVLLFVFIIAMWRRRDDQRPRAKGGEDRRRLRPGRSKS